MSKIRFLIKKIDIIRAKYNQAYNHFASFLLRAVFCTLCALCTVLSKGGSFIHLFFAHSILYLPCFVLGKWIDTSFHADIFHRRRTKNIYSGILCQQQPLPILGEHTQPHVRLYAMYMMFICAQHPRRPILFSLFIYKMKKKHIQIVHFFFVLQM